MTESTEPTHPLRIAVCALDFHPATHYRLSSGQILQPLKEPVFREADEGSLALGAIEPPDETSELAVETFRRAVMQVYLRHHASRLLDILHACSLWGVHLVVFPEFSVPGELLLDLAPAAKGMTVVFGSHTVTASLLKTLPIYRSPGWSGIAEGNNVVPVLLPDGQWKPGLRYESASEVYSIYFEPIRLQTGHTLAIAPSVVLTVLGLGTSADEYLEHISKAWILVHAEGFRFRRPQDSSSQLEDVNMLTSDQYMVNCGAPRQYPARIERRDLHRITWGGGAPDQKADPYEYLVMADLSPHTMSGVRPVSSMVLVPSMQLPAMDAIWHRLAGPQARDTASLGTVIDEYRRQLRQWPPLLAKRADVTVFKRWRRSVRELLDEEKPRSTSEMLDALAGYLPVTADTSLSGTVEHGLALATLDSLDMLTDAGTRQEIVARLNKHLDLAAWVWDHEGDVPARRIADEVRRTADAFRKVATLPGTTVEEPVHVHALKLQNLRSFSSLELELKTPPAEEGQWVIFLGDNGMGKSTILRALVLALADADVAASLVADAPAPFIRQDAAPAKIEVRLLGDESARVAEVVPFENRETLKQHRAESGRAVPVFAYGCHRGSALSGRDREPAFTPRSDVATLFDESASLTQAETWLTRLYALALSRNGQARRFFDAVLETLYGVLPGVESIEFDPQGVWWVYGTKLGRTRFAALSDGYLTTAGWVVDLIARWAERAQRDDMELDGDFAKRMTGLVIVDDVDLHLHPRWQVRLISDLRRLFPRLSFIVTTHNPLTLLGAREGEIHVLRHAPDDGSLFVRQVDIPKGTRADQVLTGEWFNLDTTVDGETQQMLQRHLAFLREGRAAADPERLEVEEALRERLGTYADTALDRLALSVASQLIREDYRELAPEERSAIRDKVMTTLRKPRSPPSVGARQ